MVVKSQQYVVCVIYGRTSYRKLRYKWLMSRQMSWPFLT